MSTNCRPRWSSIEMAECYSVSRVTLPRMRWRAWLRQPCRRGSAGGFACAPWRPCLPICLILAVFHPALFHLPEVCGKLIGLGPLFGCQARINFGESFIAHRCNLPLQAGFLAAQLIDLRIVVCPDGIEHVLANLF